MLMGADHKAKQGPKSRERLHPSKNEEMEGKQHQVTSGFYGKEHRGGRLLSVLLNFSIAKRHNHLLVEA